MTLDLGAFLPLFVEEAEAQLLLLERSLHRLEDDPADAQAVRSAFQAAHSLKGGAAMLELHGLRLVTGAFEDLLQVWRDDASRAVDGWLALAFGVRDLLRVRLRQLTPGQPPTAQEAAVAAELRAASADRPAVSAAAASPRTVTVMEGSRLAGEAVADLLRSLGAQVTWHEQACVYGGETLGVVSGQLAEEALRLGWPQGLLSVLSERPDRQQLYRARGIHAQGRPQRATPPQDLPAF